VEKAYNENPSNEKLQSFAAQHLGTNPVQIRDRSVTHKVIDGKDLPLNEQVTTPLLIALTDEKNVTEGDKRGQLLELFIVKVLDRLGYEVSQASSICITSYGIEISIQRLNGFKKRAASSSASFIRRISVLNGFVA